MRKWNTSLLNKDWLYEQHIVLQRTLREIAIEVNCSRYALTEKLKEFQIPILNHNHISSNAKEKYNNKEWLEEQHWNYNKSLEQISKELDTSTQPIFKAFKKFNIPYRKANQWHLSRETIAQVKDKDFLIKEHKENKKTITQIANETGYSKARISSIFSELEIDTILHKVDRSQIEKDLVEQIQEHYSGTIITSDRTLIYPKELDIFFPEKNLAVEVNGVLWHSSEHIDKNYHKNKTLACANKEVKLFHFWDVDIKDKRQIVLSMILNGLGISKTIYARKCVIKELSLEDSITFFKENHIQGVIQAPIRIGLYYEDLLCSAMLFGKSRYSKKAEYELLRFANKINTRCIGGASKLLNTFEKTYSPQSIISYADLSYSNGKLYKTLGFEHIHTTPPNYSYLIGNKIASRQKYQKKHLPKLLKIFDPNLSETVNMENNGFYKLWNSGQMAFLKTY